MKLHFSLSMAFIALLLFTSACKKENNSNNNPAPTGVHLTLKVDGVLWEADQSVNAINTGQALNISGLSTDGGATIILLELPTSVGTYDIGLGQSNSVSWSEDIMDGSTLHISTATGSGTLIVTEYDGQKIRGTFEFIAENALGNSKTFTEGSFYTTIL